MTGPDTLPAGARKRLGQFFTGEPLARLLAALAGAAHAGNAIDPMGGSGDMIAAVLSQHPGADTAAIEVEPVAAQTAAARLGGGVPVVHGSAFDPSSWAGLRTAWDLVITNPPYVRYQAGSADGGAPVPLPSAEQVRAGLVALIGSNPDLGGAEREAFLFCARIYSGLSDLAVPSWLLCASLVAVGGRLAVLVPNTWLSRDYAAPVLYTLRRFFDLEYVVEDKDMTWFSDVLARTTLVVARRTPDKGTAFGPGSHLRIALPASAADERGVVGAAFPHADCPERDFAHAAARTLHSRTDGTVAGGAAWMSDESDLIEALRRARARAHERWPCRVEVGAVAGQAVPERIRRAVPDLDCAFVTAEDLGWRVGQGLRTGANDFFYVALLDDGRFASPLLPGQALDLPDTVVAAAVRRQTDVPLSADPAAARTAASYVLVLDGWALPEDIDATADPSPWRPMTGDLARLVRAASLHEYDRGGSAVRLPSLSAVRTNVRAASPDRHTAARFWYHLPPLVARHRPRLYMARVNGGHPVAFPNGDGRVVDANFSTLWPADRDALPDTAMLALLRSVWTAAALEAAGTVLGGGALKVEAGHLRRLALPRPAEADVDALERYGQDLARGVGGDPTALDEQVVGLLGVADPHATAQRLRALADGHRAARTDKRGRA